MSTFQQIVYYYALHELTSVKMTKASHLNYNPLSSGGTNTDKRSASQPQHMKQLFEQTTQFRNWIYSQNELQDIRMKSHHEAIERTLHNLREEAVECYTS